MVLNFLKKVADRQFLYFLYQFLNFYTEQFELYIDFSDLIINDTNYKDQLLRYFQNNKTGQPKYEVIFENNKYKSTVYTNNPKKVFYETGYGSTKKKSEQESAKNTLIKIGILN